jgi:hypothetical protein
MKSAASDGVWALGEEHKENHAIVDPSEICAVLWVHPNGSKGLFGAGHRCGSGGSLVPTEAFVGVIARRRAVGSPTKASVPAAM